MTTFGLVKFLVSSFGSDLPELPPPLPLPRGAVCALTGEELREGYPLEEMIADTTSNIADIFRVPSRWLGVPAALCLKASQVLRGNLLALPGRGLRPFVSIASATPERPAWCDLIRQIVPGTPTVAVITDDFKRRLWPAARLSEFGPLWFPLFVVGDVERTLSIHVPSLLDCLDLVEEVYSAGFAKSAIRTNLLAQRVGCDLATTLSYERELASWRGTDELVLALFVAQKIH